MSKTYRVVERNRAENSELYHFGTLGMKWYRRRFQNEDGSLTPEGRERYGVGPARDSKAKGSLGGERSYKHNPENSRAKALEKAREARRKNLEEKKRQAEEQRKKDEEIAKLKEKYRKSPKEVMAHQELFTADEINEAIKKFNAVDQLYNNVRNERARFQDTLQRGRDTLNSLNEWGKTALSIYDTSKKLFAAVDEYNKTLKQKTKDANAEKLAAEKEKYAKDPDTLSKHTNLFTTEELNNILKRYDTEKAVKDYSTNQKNKAKEAANAEKSAAEKEKRDKLKEQYANDPKKLAEHHNMFSYAELQNALNKFTALEKIKYYNETGKIPEEKKKEDKNK